MICSINVHRFDCEGAVIGPVDFLATVVYRQRSYTREGVTKSRVRGTVGKATLNCTEASIHPIEPSDVVKEDRRE